MKKLASLFRAAQLVAHAKHNLVSGISFFGDHEFLGETYAAYESAYDDVVERMIGLGEDVSIPDITSEACRMSMNSMKEEVSKWPMTLLRIEETLRAEIDVALKGASAGTQNLLQQLADDSEKRTYKIQQR